MSVTLELVQNGKVLKSYQHEGKHFVEAPPEGTYSIRLRNNSFGQKLCVLSVDGRNVCDGTPAAFSGPGYVIAPYQTITIPGWRRTNNEVASFEFKPQEKSYASKIGDGTSNTGVIGLAVFDEKVKPAPVHIHHHHFPPIVPPVQPLPWYGGNIIRETYTSCITEIGDTGGDCDEDFGAMPMSATFGAAAAASCEEPLTTKSLTKGGTRSSSRSRTKSVSEIKGSMQLESSSTGASLGRAVEDLGTGYGAKATMFTTETTFERASKDPAFVIQVQYAMRERLIEWGVPVTKPSPSPSAFPAQPSPRIAVRAPDGWTG